MKNKKAAYFLTPSVLIIWGIIFWKISAKEEKVVNNTPTRLNHEKQNVAKIHEDYHLLINYRDPFLGSVLVAKKAKRKIMPKKVQKRIVSKPKISPPWPQIEYGGSIRNQQSKTEVAILTVNEEERLLAVNDELQGIIISKIYSDSVMVTFNNERKIIQKQRQ